MEDDRGSQKINHLINIWGSSAWLSASSPLFSEISGPLHLKSEPYPLLLNNLDQQDCHCQVVETQTDLICRFRPDGSLTFANEAYCQFLGRPAEALVGQCFFDLVPAADQAAGHHQLQDLLKLSPEQPLMTHIHQVRGADGELAWQQWVHLAFFDERGQIVEFQAVGRDVTSLKQAEMDLQQSQELLNLFFSQSLDGFFFMMLDEPVAWNDSVDKAALLDYVFDHQRVTKANQAMLDQYLAIKEEFLGLTPAELFRHDLTTGRRIWRQLFDSGRLHIEIDERRCDGSMMIVEGDYICLYDAQDRIIGHFGIQRDITDIKKAIEELCASEEKYRLLVENQTDLVVKLSSDNRFLFASPSYCELFGKTSEELLGQQFKPLVHVADWPATRSAMHALWQPPYTCYLEQRVLTVQGWRWLAWSNIAIVDVSGQVSVVIAVGRDITQRKQAELALQDSEQRFRHVLETMALAGLALDLNGCITLCNGFLLELTGWQRHEVLGRDWFELFIPEDTRDEVRGIFLATLETGHFPTHFENEILTRSGERRLIAWSNTVFQNPNGVIQGITSIGQDITEQRRVQQQLLESEERLRTALEAAQMGTWDWHIQTGQIIWSESLEKLMGMAPGSFDGRFETVQQLIHPDDRERVAETIRRAIELDEDYNIEFRFVRPDGSVRWAMGKGDVFRDAEGRPMRMAGVDVDITQRKQSELKLQASEARFRNVTENLPGAVFRYILHQDGTDQIVYMNQGCLRIWEIEESQVKDSASVLWQMIYPEDRQQVWHLVQESSKTLQPWFCEWQIKTPSNDQKWLQGIGQPEPLPNGDIAWDTLILDISDRKHAELALRQTTQRLQLFLDNTPAAVALFDETGRYLQVNQAEADLFGVMPQELAHCSFAELLPESVVDTFMARIRQVVATQTPMVVEDRLPVDGQERVFQTTLFPVEVTENGRQVLGCIATDITDLINAQNTLRRQAEEEQLMRSMTHHIRESLDLNTILETTVTEVRQVLQADRVLIYRFNPDWGGEMIVESVLAPWRAVQGTTLKDPCFEGPLVEAYRQGRVGQITDLEQANVDQCYKDLLSQFQVQANLAIPINCNGMLWGLICVHQCRGPRHWQPEEIELLRRLSDQVAIALYQSQLLTQAASRAQHEKLLNDIVNAISDSLDLEQVLQRAAEEMLATFQSSRSMAILCQPTDIELIHTATAAVPGIDDLSDKVVPIQGNSHVQKILNQEQPVAVDDVSIDPLMQPMLFLAQKFEIGAILAVSIRYRGIVRGILSVQQCHRPRHWTQDEKNLIKRVADHLAVAIQQAELYQQTQQELAERKRLEDKLRYDAFHDRLTELPNRLYLLERLSDALDRLHQHCAVTTRNLGSREISAIPDRACSYQFAVLFLDLDRFKLVNDSLGHAVGDRLLKIVARRLQTCLGATDLAARLGGDEFVVLSTDIPNVHVAVELARKIHQVLEAPIWLDAHEVFIRASIGIALSNPEYTDPNQILRDADIAMYQAKESNREYAIFDAPMHTLAVQQMQIENGLRRAIERQEFELHYQPIISLDTKQIQGFEALIRWRRADGKLVSPLDFIPVAENTGLITAIDLWTLNEACRQLHQWHQHQPRWTVNVNLSGGQFVRSDLIQQIDLALQSTGLGGEYLKLEITESVLIQNAPLAIDLLNQMKARNIQICMDDFGTGYSSLSYLHRFPIDTLKIDQSFISNLHRPGGTRGNDEIVKAIISLATNLNLTVVAEGIEAQEQEQYLHANGCHAGQGYYFAKPLPAADITQFIANFESKAKAWSCAES
jgi:diguanylate cyclase (GGDEF)-like protein/PAS domain S-box-containing protein